jgi:hypothetical protein
VQVCPGPLNKTQAATFPPPALTVTDLISDLAKIKFTSRMNMGGSMPRLKDNANREMVGRGRGLGQVGSWDSVCGRDGMSHHGAEEDEQ